MINKIRKFLGLCVHDWKVTDEGRVSECGMIVGFWTRRKCTKCTAQKYKQYVN